MKQYFYSPWEQVLLERISKAQCSLDLIVPFIKTSTLKKILVALPTDRQISIRLLTRFGKQVFSQKSSDLSAIDTVLGFASQYYGVRVHRLNRLHAKVYIIDNSEMFITSSNLSYSGLIANFEIAVHVTEPSEVSSVRAILDGQMLGTNLITLTDVADMATELQIDLLAHIKGLYQDTVGDEEVSEMSEAQALVEQVDEESPPTPEQNPIESAKQSQILKDINHYLSSRSVASLNQLGGKPFESISRLAAPSAEEPVATRTREESVSRADRDQRAIEEYLRNLFGHYFSKQWTHWSELASLFTHASWLNHFRRQEFPKIQAYHQMYEQLGGDVLEFNIARRITIDRCFSESSFGWYAINTQYIETHCCPN